MDANPFVARAAPAAPIDVFFTKVLRDNGMFFMINKIGYKDFLTVLALYYNIIKDNTKGGHKHSDHPVVYNRNSNKSANENLDEDYRIDVVSWSVYIANLRRKRQSGCNAQGSKHNLCCRWSYHERVRCV